MGPFKFVSAADAEVVKEAEKTTEISDKTATFLVIVDSDCREKLLLLYIALPSYVNLFISQKPR